MFKCVPNRIRIWIFGLQESRKEPLGAGTRINTKQIDSDPGHICGGGECSHHCAALVSLNLWGCVRATRSLHDEVPGIWFTSWPLFFLIFLQLLLTLLLLYFSYSSLLTSSSIVAVLIAKAGHVWVSWPEEFLLYFLSLTLQQVCYC